MTIYTTSHGTATPNPYAARIAAEVEREIAAEWQRQASVSLAKIMQNPVPKGKTYE